MSNSAHERRPKGVMVNSNQPSFKLTRTLFLSNFENRFFITEQGEAATFECTNLIATLSIAVSSACRVGYINMSIKIITSNSQCNKSFPGAVGACHRSIVASIALHYSVSLLRAIFQQEFNDAERIESAVRVKIN